MKARPRALLVLLALTAIGAIAACDVAPPDAGPETVTASAALRKGDAVEPGVVAPEPPRDRGPVRPEAPAVVVEPADEVERELPDERLSLVARSAGLHQVRARGRFQPLALGQSGEVDDEYLVIEDERGLAAAGLPPAIEGAVRAELAASGDPVILSRKSLAREAAAAAQGGPAVAAACSNATHTIDETLSKTVPFNFQRNFSAGSGNNRFTGSAQLYGSAGVALTGTISYRYVRGWFCIPVGIKFMGVGARGATSLRATGRLAGQFTGAMTYRKELFTVPLATVGYSIPLVDIGIGVKFDLPLSVGFSAGGAVSATVVSGLDAGAEIHASCIRGAGCDVGGSTRLDFRNDGVPAVGVTGLVDVTAFAEAAVRGKVLIVVPVAEAQIGVGARLKNQLWGYAGNTCGDADGDGSNELVTGGLLDTRGVIDLFARVNLFGSSVLDASTTLVDKHLHTFDFGGAALDPIFTVTPVVLHHHLSTGRVIAEGRMRPCYPFPAPLAYRVRWGDDQSDAFSAAPLAAFSRNHQYAQAGWRTVTLEAGADATGRSINRTAQRTLYVGMDLPVFTGGVATRR